MQLQKVILFSQIILKLESYKEISLVIWENCAEPLQQSLDVPYTYNLVFSAALDARYLLQERYSLWENRYLGQEHRQAGTTLQGQVYNFLERPTGWKCLVYHSTV